MSGTAQETADDGAPAAPEVSPEIEARARNMGWTPREVFRGEAERWVDAPTFVERAERMLPLLQERNRALDRTVTGLKEQMTDQQKLLGDLVSRTRKAEKVGYDRAMRELQQKRAEAVSQGDADTFNRVEAEIQSLGPPPEPEPAQPRQNAAPANEVNPVVTAWVRRNTWFNRDPEANAAAVAALSVVEKEFPGDSLEQHLDEVEQRIARRFPEHFPRRQARSNGNGADYEDSRRSSAPQVMASSSAPERRAGPRSFEAIPAEHKREYERQRKMLDGKGSSFTKEEFAQYYWEAEGEA
jgi:hypothetical protein